MMRRRGRLPCRTRDSRIALRLGAHTVCRWVISPTTRQPFLAVTLNIWHDQQDWPARCAVILDTLRTLRPDVVFLQEVLQKEGLPNQAQTLAESLGATFVFASVDPPGAPKRYGNAILTRHRIAATNEIHLKPLDDYRVAVHARLEVEGRSVDAYATHLHQP
jgi:endonuclease/exonuclease/phosphatase family metal-dependent hydrolase